MKTAEDDLAVVKADDDATQGEVKAAEAVVDAAELEVDARQMDHNVYLAMKPPTYDMAALAKALDLSTPFDPTGEPANVVNRGEVTGEGYDKVTWPAPELGSRGSKWVGSVYEKTTDDMTDSVVVYTNVEAPTSLSYDDYYGDTGSLGVGVTAVAADNTGVLMLSEIADLADLVSASGLPSEPTRCLRSARRPVHTQQKTRPLREASTACPAYSHAVRHAQPRRTRAVPSHWLGCGHSRLTNQWSLPST